MRVRAEQGFWTSSCPGHFIYVDLGYTEQYEGAEQTDSTTSWWKLNRSVVVLREFHHSRFSFQADVANRFVLVVVLFTRVLLRSRGLSFNALAPFAAEWRSRAMVVVGKRSRTLKKKRDDLIHPREEILPRLVFFFLLVSFLFYFYDYKLVALALTHARYCDRI